MPNIIARSSDQWAELARRAGPSRGGEEDHGDPCLSEAGTIVWNGPVGVLEFDQFGQGTKAVAQAIAGSHAFSLAAISKYGVTDRISYISTGGGAFLEFLEGKKLPAIEILEARATA